jgi:hypothetical protein
METSRGKGKHQQGRGIHQATEGRQTVATTTSALAGFANPFPTPRRRRSAYK